MPTNFTTSGKFRYRHKFAVIFAIAIILTIASLLMENNSLMWGAGGAFLISMPYAVMSVWEVVDKLNQ